MSRRDFVKAVTAVAVVPATKLLASTAIVKSPDFHLEHRRLPRQPLIVFCTGWLTDGDNVYATGVSYTELQVGMYGRDWVERAAEREVRERLTRDREKYRITSAMQCIEFGSREQLKL